MKKEINVKTNKNSNLPDFVYNILMLNFFHIDTIDL